MIVKSYLRELNSPTTMKDSEKVRSFYKFIWGSLPEALQVVPLVEGRIVSAHTYDSIPAGNTVMIQSLYPVWLLYVQNQKIHMTSSQGVSPDIFQGLWYLRLLLCKYWNSWCALCSSVSLLCAIAPGHLRIAFQKVEPQAQGSVWSADTNLG